MKKCQFPVVDVIEVLLDWMPTAIEAFDKTDFPFPAVIYFEESPFSTTLPKSRKSWYQVLGQVWCSFANDDLPECAKPLWEILWRIVFCSFRELNRASTYVRGLDRHPFIRELKLVLKPYNADGISDANRSVALQQIYDAYKKYRGWC